MAEIVRWTTSARRPSGKLVLERCGTDRSRTVEHAPRLHAILGRTLRADTRAQTSRELAHVARKMGWSAARRSPRVGGVSRERASEAQTRPAPQSLSVRGGEPARVARCDRARGAGEICHAPRRDVRILAPFAQRGVPEIVSMTSWSFSCAARTASSMSPKTYARSNGAVEASHGDALRAGVHVRMGRSRRAPER